ncbi:MAG TPA: hypothetical protein IAB18_08330 [Candidatus Avisuccinivibrio pullicola]|nr:hypothetical protein [Candidatus Avisuccinivibrio pullicola]
MLSVPRFPSEVQGAAVVWEQHGVEAEDSQGFLERARRNAEAPPCSIGTNFNKKPLFLGAIAALVKIKCDELYKKCDTAHKKHLLIK